MRHAAKACTVRLATVREPSKDTGMYDHPIERKRLADHVPVANASFHPEAQSQRFMRLRGSESLDNPQNFGGRGAPRWPRFVEQVRANEGTPVRPQQVRRPEQIDCHYPAAVADRNAALTVTWAEALQLFYGLKPAPFLPSQIAGCGSW